MKPSRRSSRSSTGSSAFSLESLQALQTTPPSLVTESTLASPPTPAPPASKPETALVSPEPPRNPTTPIKGGVLESQEAIHGGREGIIDLLSLTPLEKKERHFYQLLGDPNRQDQSITKLAREAGLRPLQVLEMLRSAAGAAASALAMGTMTAALPAVVRDLAEKSVDAKVDCPDCGGSREFNGSACLRCNGQGMILRPSDLDRQKIVLETTGIIKKQQGGVNVSVNQQVGVVSPGNFFSKFVRQSDSDAYSIDAEVLDAEKTAES